MDQQGEEVEEEAVPHVEDTADLGEDNPDQAEPPEVQSSEGCSQDVAERAGEEVTKDVLYGVTFTVVLALSLALLALTSVFSTSSIVAPDPLQDQRCVPNDLPGQLQSQGHQEAKDPGGVEVLRAPEQVEDQPGHHQAGTVRVKDVAGGPGGVPLSRKERRVLASQSSSSLY